MVGFYHSLPNPARSVAASLRGLYLRSWRYGPETEQLVAQALERELWSAEAWRGWQEARLALVLERAATQVPYYRDQWTARRRMGDRASWQLLENWPLLEKESLRRNPRGFVADDCQVRQLFHERTSGTSGTPLDLWWSRSTVRAWYALFEARWRRWHGVTRDDRWAILGGQLVTPVAQKDPPFWVWNAPLNQLYMSSYHLAPDLLPHFFSALRRYRVRYLFGYSSALHALAYGTEACYPTELRLAVAITNAEPVLDDQRAAISGGFRCPVRETYGMAEIVAAAGECEAGRLHLWPEVGWLEVMEGTDHVPRGKPGEFICTGLLNADMPLIRYRVGDRGALPADEHPCTCGRGLPLLDGVAGRSNDVLITPEGRRVFWLNPVLYGIPVREAQIVQETLHRIRVRYVAAPAFTAAAGRTMVERLRDRLGNVQVILEEVAEVPRGANGKFRAVVSEVEPAELRRVMR